MRTGEQHFLDRWPAEQSIIGKQKPGRDMVRNQDVGETALQGHPERPDSLFAGANDRHHLGPTFDHLGQPLESQAYCVGLAATNGPSSAVEPPVGRDFAHGSTRDQVIHIGRAEQSDPDHRRALGIGACNRDNRHRRLLVQLLDPLHERQRFDGLRNLGIDDSRSWQKK